MSIRTSIYDFFAYTIPGGLLLLAILGGLQLFAFVDIIYIVGTPFFSEIRLLIIALVCSYVFGHLTRPICSVWMKLFESRPIPNLAMAEFKAIHPTIEINIEPSTWPIWFASIRRENMELTLEVDRMMATAYFLRGVSLFFALLFLLLVSGLISGRLDWWFILCSLIVPFFSFISAKESIKFNKWFYYLIYELIISREEPFYFKHKEESSSKTKQQ